MDTLIEQRGRETLGSRIRRRRKEMRLTQIRLAELAGINQGFLSEIERDRRRPSTPTLNALSVALDVPQSVLVGAGREHDNPQPAEMLNLPLFGTIPAGTPSESQEQLQLFPVLRHMWSADHYCLRLTFDSMEPTLKPGDIVLVHYRPDVDPELVQGKICACLIDGEPVLKRVSVDRQGQRQSIILRGDNPSIKPIVIGSDREFSIQGVVTSLVSRVL